MATAHSRAVESGRKTCTHNIAFLMGEGSLAHSILGASEGSVVGELDRALAGLFGGAVVLLALEVSSSGSNIIGRRAVSIDGGVSGRSAGLDNHGAAAPGKGRALEQ